MKNQHQKSKTPVLLDHSLGELFRDFYAQWNYDGHRLKTLCSLMYDVYISETEDLPEINDAALFTRGFIEVIRNYQIDIPLDKLGKLFTKHMLEPLQEGDIYIVENMFYTCVNNLTNPEKRQEIIQFYRSLESLLNQVNKLKGEKSI